MKFGVNFSPVQVQYARLDYNGKSVVWAYTDRTHLEEDLKHYYGNLEVLLSAATEQEAAQTTEYSGDGYEYWLMHQQRHAYNLGNAKNT